MSRKLTSEEEAAMKNGKTDPTGGQPQNQNQNQAFRRLLAALMGEERRWQPKGTPSKSHLLGRAFRDLALPWLANEINYHINQRKERELQDERTLEEKYAEIQKRIGQTPASLIRPALLGNVTNPDIRAQIQKEIGTTPQPSPQPTQSPAIADAVLRMNTGGTNFGFPVDSSVYPDMFDATANKLREDPTTLLFNGGAGYYPRAGGDYKFRIPLPTESEQPIWIDPYGEHLSKVWGEQPTPTRELLGALPETATSEDPLIQRIKELMNGGER